MAKFYNVVVTETSTSVYQVEAADEKDAEDIVWHTPPSDLNLIRNEGDQFDILAVEEAE